MSINPINVEQKTELTITAIVIDDENNSREALIKKLQTHCAEVKVLAACKDAAEGIEAINLHQPKIVFLDIEMPRMNGFTMLQQLPVKNFHLVFTTAYNQYAIEAIRFSAFDYLVKPIDTGELVRAVNRVKENLHKNHIDTKLAILMEHLLKEKTVISKIALSTMESIDYIALNDLIYLEAVGNYTNVHVNQSKPFLASKTLKEFEEILPTNQFCRIHNAIIVNVAYLKKFIKGGEGGQLVLQNGVVLDIARRRKEELLQLMATFAKRI